MIEGVRDVLFGLAYTTAMCVMVVISGIIEETVRLWLRKRRAKRKKEE